MSFFVYVLKSKSVKPVTYVGHTNNLKKRFILHNSGAFPNEQARIVKTLIEIGKMELLFLWAKVKLSHTLYSTYKKEEN